MITKETILDQIEITRSGIIQLRFGILLIEDGREIDRKWHRTAIEPGGSVDQQLSLVDENLRTMGKAPISAEGKTRLKSVVSVVHTNEAIKAYQEMKKHLGTET